MSKPEFAIVGAGLGGIVTGILLQRAGYKCKIYEQASTVGNVGAGINIAQNSTRLLKAVGLEGALRKVGIEPRIKLSRHYQTGEVMFTVPVKEITATYGAPFFAFHRSDLHAALASSLTDHTISLGKRLVAVGEDGTGCTLQFLDGSTAQADAVIGADGVHSKVRGAMNPGENATYHGLVAYRAIIPAKDVKAPADDNVKWWAPDRYVIIYYLSERRDLVHFVASTPEPLGESFSPKEADRRVFYDAFAEFNPIVQDILRAAQSVTRWPLLEGRPFRPWSKKNVVLLGDACHATTPHMGQGAGMAFEDAFVLVRCVAENDTDLSTAFAKYEHNRFERTARIQQELHDNKWTKTNMDHKWVYGYDAANVPLEEPSAQPTLMLRTGSL